MPEWLGKTIGNVRIDKYLAHGGMAEVYLGTNLNLDRPVAIKVMHSYVEENPDLLARFQREARVVAGLRHPNIVQVYDFNTIDSHPYIVMEYLKGPPLSTYMRNLHTRGERIPHHEIARLLKGLTAALDYAHEQGVIHRDIKPGNIMLHSKADEIPLDMPLTNDVEGILTDFGLVRIANAATQTASGMVSGTPSYMSPEQARGEKTDHRTDIYSLGVIVYEMLAGRVPFEADSTLSVIYMQINEPPPPIEGISSALQSVVDRAMAKDPEDRFQSCRELSAAFYLAIGMKTEAETIVGSLPKGSTDLATVLTQKPKTTTRKTPAWIGVAIGALLLLVVALGAFRFISGSSSASKATDVPSAEVAQSSATPVPSVEVTVLPDSANMVEVTAGTYEVGLTSDDTDHHVAPLSVLLGGFWIDKYPVTNLEYKSFMDAKGTAQPQIWPDGDNQPVRGVTWSQASAYCSWANKRLPKEAEWESAGRGSGTNPQLYPWGNDPTNNGETLKLPEQDTYAVGTVSYNKSPFGVYDMVGNIWEWVGDPYSDVPPGNRILRGGRFGLPINDLAYRLAVDPETTPYIKFAGFRCAADQVK